MRFTSERQRSIRALTWALILSAILAVVAAFSIGDSVEVISPFKRSAISLAMMQVYRICDGDKNGVFSKEELQCLQKVLFILFTGR